VIRGTRSSELVHVLAWGTGIVEAMVAKIDSSNVLIPRGKLVQQLVALLELLECGGSGKVSGAELNVQGELAQIGAHFTRFANCTKRSSTGAPS
jgi:hypothetical protein